MTRRFAVGLARACGGAIIFGLPLLMTMEMWSLGVTMERTRLALLVLLTLPVLVGLSHFAGFEETFGARDDTVDALVAWAVGFGVAAGVLLLFGVIDARTSLHEAAAMIALQAVPGSIGALLAQSQLGGRAAGSEDDRESEEESGPMAASSGRPSGYASQLFLMLAGALFLAFNVAPTEEIVLIAYKMSLAHVLTLAALSLALMHAFVYAVEFHGQHSAPSHVPAWSEFVRLTIVGYAIALLVSAYILWTFGRLEDSSWAERIAVTLVLALPSAIGAAAARLIL